MAEKNIISSLVSSLRRPNPKATTLLLVVFGFFIIYFDATTNTLTVLNRWLMAIFFLAFTGVLIRVVNGLNGLGTTGIYLIGTKHGLRLIDHISQKYKRFWLAMAVWGIIIGFGLFSWPIVKDKVSKKMFLFGIVSLLVLANFAVPATIYGLQFINLPQIQSAVASAESSAPQSGISLTAIAVNAVGLISGFSGYIIFLLAINGATILLGIYHFALTVASGAAQTSLLQNQVPGVAPLIPGIDVPLFQTIIALIIILVVHEFSHGILARIDKVKLTSIGMVVFGVIPIGAYVEPDEKAVNRLDNFKQSRIMAAGISANMIVAVLFLVITLFMVAYVVPGLYSNTVLVQSTTQGLPAYNVIMPGMQILAWNGHQIKNLSSFTVAAATDVPNAIVTIVTNTGNYSFTAVSIDGSKKGYVGITPYQPLSTSLLATIGYFVYTVVVLTFMFNLFVGIVNLLPVPGFDGWRLYKANVKDQRIVKALAAFVVLVLIINILPLFFAFV